MILRIIKNAAMSTEVADKMQTEARARMYIESVVQLCIISQ